MKALVISLSIATWILFMYATFTYNFQTWCANPQGQGNSIIQPFCK